MSILQDKRILLVVTGGIAAYKSCELLRLLVKGGADVQVIMTENAEHFIGRTTFEALSGKPVITSEWTSDIAIPHIKLREGRDVMVIAPATANIMAKLAAGIADDLVSSTALARNCPLLIAPAMNVFMWNNPATQRNVSTLKGDGIHLSGPEAGLQACGDRGEGRMKEPEGILSDIISLLTPKTLTGRRVLITGGPTFEAIDPVRGITNLSSGKQAVAIAKAAFYAGADVTLVLGPVSIPPPQDCRIINVTSANEMLETVRSVLNKDPADIFISVAAVSDWRPISVSQQKLKKTPEVDTLNLRLVKNPGILEEVAQSGVCKVVIGFAAETENLIENARLKLIRKKADLIVANPSKAIGSSQNTPFFITENDVESLGTLSKQDLADKILAKAESLLKEKEQ